MIEKREKKGQITIFMIIGLVVIVIIALLLFARSRGVGIEPKKFLSSQIEPIKNSVTKCVGIEGVEALKLLGRQGGDLNPARYLKYKNENVAFLCFNKPGKKECINRMLTRREIEGELNVYVREQLYRCIHLEDFIDVQKYELIAGELAVNTMIASDEVFVGVDYPITLKKKGIEVGISDFSTRVQMPLGKLLKVTDDVLDAESEFGEFHTLAYELLYKGLYEIRKEQPYPDKIYILKIKDNPYIFQFAVEGEPYEKK